MNHSLECAVWEITLACNMNSKGQRIKRITCGIIEGLVALGSMLLGTGFGMKPGYPYFMFPASNFGQGLFYETLIQAGNGIFLKTIEKKYVFSRSERMKVFLGNLVLSFALFVISFGIMTTWDPTPGVILYNTFDRHQKNLKSEWSRLSINH